MHAFCVDGSVALLWGGERRLAAQKADLNYVHVYENRQDATNTVAVGQTGTGVQLKVTSQTRAPSW